jgi:hypothetical protein
VGPDIGTRDVWRVHPGELKAPRNPSDSAVSPRGAG